MTTLLTAITGRRYGLPQQNHPSDVLAEAYIDVLERRLHRANARVWRYSDDFRIATDSWSDALATVDLLEREVRRIGLTLNDSKTVIRRWYTYEASLKQQYDALAGHLTSAYAKSCPAWGGERLDRSVQSSGPKL